MINTIIIEGRLTADPKLRYTSQGTPVANFRLASNRPYKNAQGDYEADFVDVVVWRKMAEAVGNNLSKGRLVSVQGRFQTRQYDDQSGTRRTAYEIMAQQVNFLEKKAGGLSTAPTESETEEAAFPDDLPF